MSNDRSYLSALQDYYTRHHAFPSYSSIGTLLGLRSKSSVAALVARLKLGGYIESTPDRRIAPTRRFFERPLAEAPVHAGLPNPIDDAPADALTLDDYLIERPSQTVLVRVKGDSMTDAGIFDGDLVVVEKRSTARRGDIVIAIVDNQFTLEAPRARARPVHPAPRKQGLSGHPTGRHAGNIRRHGGAGPQIQLTGAALRRAPLVNRRRARLRPARRRTSPRVPCRSAPGRSPCSRWCRRAKACATRSKARRRHRAACDR